ERSRETSCPSIHLQVSIRRQHTDDDHYSDRLLGMHAIKERPIAVDGEVVIRPMMYLALTYDHRLVDGEQSVKFLVRLKDLLEDPARLMLEI
ncbi:MAG: hypothetical protein CME04_06095, partial [Gemmatimonadaceae bacterium]|nr:hypothetical protein [Gemmatimonadaceae bacterium]